MKSCLGLTFIITMLVLAIAAAAFLWYMSRTTEFQRTGSPGTTPPKARVVR
ncbi:MAG: hypothetical protein V4733_11715 [Verrucomicrobiota bacterium]